MKGQGLLCGSRLMWPHVSSDVDTVPCWRFRSGPADEDLRGSRDPDRRDVACWYPFPSDGCFGFAPKWSLFSNCFFLYCLQGMNSLPDYVSFKIFPGTPLEHIFSAAGDDLLELLQGLYTFNPLTRTTATQVMLHRSSAAFRVASQE